MELLAATQGVDLLRPLKTTVKLQKIRKEIRKKIPFFVEDAPFYESIEDMVKTISNW